MIGRTRRRAERADGLVHELRQRVGIEHRFRLLEQEGLVRRPPALRHELQLVLVAGNGLDLDLRRQVRAGIALLEHREWRHLRVAQVRAGVGVVDAVRQPGGIVGAGEHVLALVAVDDRRPRVLTRRQHHLRGDHGVLQHLHCHEPVVVGGLRVIEDRPKLRQMIRPEEVRHVADRLGCKQPQRFRIDLQNLSAADRCRLDQPLDIEPAVLGIIDTQLEHGFIVEIGHDSPCQRLVPSYENANRIQPHPGTPLSGCAALVDSRS